MVKKIFTSLIILFITVNSAAQTQQPSNQVQFTSNLIEDSLSSKRAFNISNFPLSTNAAPNKKRVILVAGLNVSFYAVSFIALNKAWYRDYPKTSFHFFNDNKEWNQMDKIGHVWTSYQVSRGSAEVWRWTALSEKKSIILGGISGVAYQTIIEIQDGYSTKWGFSWADMAANILGSSLYVAQELKWKEQRVGIKFGSWAYDYPEDLITRRNELFGKSPVERILKDYNSQTYWITANLKSILKSRGLPQWLNISAGYSSDGMLGGKENLWTDKSGVLHNRSDISRIRHFYLAPDIDLTKIKTGSKFMRSFFFLLNTVKFPAPAIEINQKGKLKFHYIKF